MQSIRLSLVVYFLILLAVGLGAVSVVAYQYTRRTLKEKEGIRAELSQLRYENDCRRARDDLDDGLIEQARILASLTRLQFEGRKPFRVLAEMKLLSAVHGASSLLATPLWLAEASERRPSAGAWGSAPCATRGRRGAPPHPT